jgi:hypothetical protein
MMMGTGAPGGLGAVALVLAFITGCGSQPHQSAASGGSSTGQQSERQIHLPGQLPVEGPHEGLTAPAEAVIAHVRAELERRYAPPADRSLVVMNQWLTAEMKPWVEARLQAIGRALQLIEHAEGDDPLTSAIVYWAVASLQDDTCRVWSTMPVPNELANDAELQHILLSAMWEKAAHIAHQALASYAACIRFGQQTHAAVAERCLHARDALRGFEQEWQGRLRDLQAEAAANPPEPVDPSTIGEWLPPAEP